MSGMVRRALLACAATSALAAPVDAVTIDFESVPTGQCATPSNPFSTQGFEFSTLGSAFFSCDGARTDLASNGTITIGSEDEVVVTFAPVGGGTFSLLSIDLSEVFTDVTAGNQVSIEGQLSGGGEVSVTFDLDGQNDGPGGGADFQIFALPGGFLNLTSVTMTRLHAAPGDLRFMFDNVVVAPEPAAVALLACALTALCARRRG